MKKGSARALAVALAGTLGVGNIAGVASAIALGGAGAVFWMWVSALLAMFLKYAEVVLALRHRHYDRAGHAHGGAPYYVQRAFKGRVGRVLGGAFALLCILCMFTLGGVVQSAAASEALFV
ncbi:MAG: alanine:cation symporter family protein, partial [Clostridia bacterium]|nr:alanine:cation symporter family protein [Clostridia bacterium]